ncbi:MarR family transcriptional regulator [Paenibacillus odorifer]|uniref:MarR family winged helix-turn-helix transcriptional regulator n=1 Tax=Paenibacillus TaxID=44249 RepID=UPI00201636A4|nr:MarR family transcriptional regulator [Paenibacillus odorifer]
MIEDEIRELLDRISAEMRRDYAELLRELNLHVGQEQLLCRLWRTDGMTQIQLSERLNCEPPTITNMVKSLENHGFVVRKRDPEDGRVSRVYLTPAGRNLCEPVEQIWNKQLNKLLAGIIPEERLLLRRLMKQMADNLA